MKTIFRLALAALLLTQTAFAQTATAPAATLQTDPLTDGAPAPVVQAPTTQDITKNPDAMAQVSKALGNTKNMQQNMGQALVAGVMMNCVQQQAGKEATQAFYTKIQQAGTQIGNYCKTDHPVQARDLALATIDANASDPVAKTTLSCYNTQQPTIQSMGGPKVAGDMAKYAHWLENPAAAHAEITAKDICR